MAQPPSDDTTCREWLTQIQEAIAEADATFAGISPDAVELLIGQEPSGGGRTLFRVLIAPSVQGAVDRSLGSDLALGLDTEGLRAVYNDRLFDPDLLQSWVEDTATLLRALPQGEGNVNDVLAAATAKRAALHPAPMADLYAAPSVAESIVAAAIQNLDAPAVVDADSSVNYGQLLQRYLGVATALRAEGVLPGDAVGLFVGAGASYVAALLGTIHIGAVPVPLDAQSPAIRLAQAAGETGMRVLLTDHTRSVKAAEICAGVPDPPPRIIQVDDAQRVAGGRNRNTEKPVAVAPESPGYILFTSGSTGRPKGVVQSRRALDSIVDWQVRRSGAGTSPRTLQRSALSFDVALQEILSTLADAGTLFVPADQKRQDLSHVAQLIRDWQVQRVFMPPSGLHALLASVDSSLLSSLNEVVCAGEPLLITGTVRRAFREIDSRLDNQYGPTETHVCTAATVDGDPFAWPDNPSVGRPVPGVTARVIDLRGRPVPIGTPGELVIAGQTVALGYLHGPDGRFHDEPGHNGNGTVRSYWTGDFARQHPDGTFEFLNRRDEQIKVRGYRVEPGEVEAAARGTGLVSDAVAFGLSNGSTVERIGLAVVPSDPAGEFDMGSLLGAMAERLPSYMVPRPAETVTYQTFDLTPTGKVDKRAVALNSQASYQNRDISLDSGDQAIRSLWLRCLGINDCDDDETFVALGGDSLAAVELAAALQDTVGLSVSLRQLLAGMTLRALGTASRGGSSVIDSATRPADPQPRNMPLTIELPGVGRIQCVSAAEARHLYLDVVASRNYERFGMLDGPIDVVIDVGANIGMFALRVLDLHPGAHVVAIEPHPGFAQSLRANLGGRATIIEAAAARDSGDGELLVYDQMPAMSSLEPEPDYDRELMASLMANQLIRAGGTQADLVASVTALVQEGPVACPVHTVRLSDVMAELAGKPVSLLKIDVQHGEMQVLLGLENANWDAIERIVVEVQDRGTQLQEVRHLLEGRGFSTAVHSDDVLHAGTSVKFLYAWAAGLARPRA